MSYEIGRPDTRGTFDEDIPGSRLVKINSTGGFGLAGATDIAVAATVGKPTATQRASNSGKVAWLNTAGRVAVELASTAIAGNVANQAANGMVQDGSGTVRVGVFYTSGSIGDVVEITPA